MLKGIDKQEKELVVFGLIAIIFAIFLYEPLKIFLDGIIGRFLPGGSIRLVVGIILIFIILKYFKIRK